MANWSDPRMDATAFSGRVGLRGAEYDAGLRSYMLSVYNYMASAVLLTGIVALGVAMSGVAEKIFVGGGLLPLIVSFAPLGLVFAMSFGQSSMSTGTLRILFWAYAVAMGVSMSLLFLVYSETSIAQAFFAAAAGFAGLSLYGYVTERNLSAMGSFLIVGLVGLIVASLLNVFLHSGPLALVISLVGVLIFAGFTAYDTQRTKALYAQVAGTGLEGRAVVMAALNLYLDFINMFIFILRIIGNSRN